MPLSDTAPLRHALTAALPRRPFAIRFWDGTEVPATEPGAPTLTLYAPRRHWPMRCVRRASSDSGARTSPG